MPDLRAPYSQFRSRLQFDVSRGIWMVDSKSYQFQESGLPITLASFVALRLGAEALDFREEADVRAGSEK